MKRLIAALLTFFVLTGPAQAHGPMVVLALIEAAPDQEPALQAALEALVEPSQAEPGNIVYELHANLDNPTLFMFYEIWEDELDYYAHQKTSHYLAFQEQVPDLLVRPAVTTYWRTDLGE